MKRLLLLSLIINLLGFSAKAASGGPDRFGYTWKDSNEPGGPVYAWWDITGTGTLVTGLKDDNAVGPFPMLQGFQYFWYQPTSFWIGSNGYLSFEKGILKSPFNFNLNWNRGVKNVVAPILTDFDFSQPGNTGRCYYQISGDSLCVSWVNVPVWGTTGPVGSNSFQVIFNRANHSITFNYQQFVGNTPAGIITYNSHGGFIGTTLMNGVVPPSNYSIRIEYPTNNNFSIYDVSIKEVVNEGSWAETRKVGEPIRRFRVKVKNEGNVIAQSLTITGSINRQGGFATPLGGRIIGTLLPGQDSVIELTTPWTPNQVGRYTFSALISSTAIDSIPINNRKGCKIMVIDSTHGSLSLSYSDGLPRSAFFNGSISYPHAFGVYLKPAFYPLKIKGTHVFHRFPPNFDFSVRLYKDDGPQGSPGTLIDSVLIAPNKVIGGVYNRHPLSGNDITLQGGGVYMLVEYYAGNVTLGCDTNSPTSSFQYEIVDGVWSEFSEGRWAEMAMGLAIEGIPQRDLRVSRIVSPTPGWRPPGVVPISGWIKNQGQLAVNQFVVGYQAGSAAPVTTTYFGASIQPGDSVLFNFPPSLLPNSMLPDENFCMWTQLSADSIKSNDSICYLLQATTATIDRKNQQFQIFPNPLKPGQPLTIRLSGRAKVEGQWQIDLYDAAGRKCYGLEWELVPAEAEQAINLRLPTLYAGIYWLSVRRGDDQFRAAVVISGP